MYLFSNKNIFPPPLKKNYYFSTGKKRKKEKNNRGFGLHNSHVNETNTLQQRYLNEGSGSLI